MSLLERLSRDDRFAWEIGCRLVEIREGYARAELKVEERHLNAAGMCQGGVMFTLADLTFAAVCNSRGILTVGVSNNISYIKSAGLGETITAECNETVNHHKLPCSEIKVKNESGEVLAVMTGMGYRTPKDFPFESLM